MDIKPDSPKLSVWRAFLVLTVFGIFSLIAGELGMRLRDWIVNGTPILANPSYDSVLRMHRYGIWVGRPNAHYRKWHLNAFGFRSEPIALQKRPGCARVMIIGASEMFGLYESPGKDFAADLTRDLKPSGCFEVLNAAMAGMGIGAAHIYWSHYLVRFKPDIVLLYPAPDIGLIAYLQTHGHSASARPLPPIQAKSPHSWRFRSRLLGYLRSFIHMPQFITNWRTQHTIYAEIHAHPPSWRLHHVPAAVVKAYATRLNSLVQAIRATGAMPVLMTHALRVTQRDLSSDLSARLWLLTEGPRATAHTWVQNDILSNDQLKAIARKYHLPVIHLSRELSGCRACFFDAPHFTNEGAARAASAATKELVIVARQIKDNTAHTGLKSNMPHG